MSEDKKKHSSNPNPNIKAWLKPNNEALIKGFAKDNEMTKSSTLNFVVKEFFKSLPEDERNYYLNKGIEENK